jgi:glycosyltransferase involved in cell wall biosynthesis
MRVLIPTEARFDRTADGTCWNVGSSGYEFWQRYLDEFDEVCILARVRDVQRAPTNGLRADGPNVSLAPLPYYLGPWAYLRQYYSFRRAARRAVEPDDAVIVRAPSIAGDLVVSALNKDDRPFGIEVVGDPLDVFVRGAVRSAFRPLLRQSIPRALRRQCARACAAAYVTSDSLQRRYPAISATHVTRYSSIDLAEEAFVRDPRPPSATAGTRVIVFVGSLEQLYKAPDILIDAVAAAIRRGADLRLNLIGDGKHRRELEDRAIARGISDRVRFLGHLPPGESVRRELDAAHLFVLPSRTEGLPRALIEAMARALPCIGSNIGGIPELLSPSEQVLPGDVDVLEARLLEVLGDPERLARLSRDNLEKAREYHTEALRPRRRAFYRAVREATVRWQRGNQQRRDAFASRSAGTVG